MPEDHKWHEITDLPPDLRSLTSNELAPLHRIWLQQKDSLAEQRVVEFNQQLKREWAIETGAIEGVYFLERRVTEIMIEHDINSSLIPHTAPHNSPEHGSIIASRRFIRSTTEMGGLRELSPAWYSSRHAGFPW